jgi:hypothetical protein
MPSPGRDEHTFDWRRRPRDCLQVFHHDLVLAVVQQQTVLLLIREGRIPAGAIAVTFEELHPLLLLHQSGIFNIILIKLTMSN